MTMQESYVDAINWLSQHNRNGIFIKVKSEAELNKYKKYFADKIASDLFSDEAMLNRIEWKIDQTL